MTSSQARIDADAASVSSKILPRTRGGDEETVVSCIPITHADVWNPNRDMDRVIQQAITEHMMNSPTVTAVSPTSVNGDGDGEGAYDGEDSSQLPKDGDEAGELCAAKGWKPLLVAGAIVVALVVVVVAVFISGNSDSETDSDRSVPSPVGDPTMSPVATSNEETETLTPTSDAMQSETSAMPSFSSVVTTSSPTPVPTSTPSVVPFPYNSSFRMVGNSLYGETELEQFGGAVSMSSDATIVAVGSPSHPQQGTEAGAVNVYRNSGGRLRKIGPSIFGRAIEEEFGISVALSGDGSLLAVGAREANQEGGVNTGYVRTFLLSEDNQWTPLGSDLDGDNINDWFGHALALSRDGTTLVVGAPQTLNGNGYAKVYRRDADSAVDWILLQTFIGGIGDAMGYSVSVSADGSYVAVGSTQGGTEESVGFVTMYKLNTDMSYVEVDERLSGVERQDYFGESISLSDDGKTLAVGSLKSRGDLLGIGQAQVFTLVEERTWTKIGSTLEGETERGFFGAVVDLSADGQTLLVGADGINAGSVSIYHYVENDWRLVGNPLSGESALEEFGDSAVISANGRVVVVGAPRNDVTGPDAGAVSVYEI